MRGTRAALRYAKAMLSYAQESKADKAVAKDMHALISLLHEKQQELSQYGHQIIQQVLEMESQLQTL